MLADEGLGEWGFSALVEVDGHPILFDTGYRPDTVLKNAADVKIDLSRVIGLVLSQNHGHPHRRACRVHPERNGTATHLVAAPAGTTQDNVPDAGAHCTGIGSAYPRRRLALDRKRAVVGAVGASFDLSTGINPLAVAK